MVHQRAPVPSSPLRRRCQPLQDWRAWDCSSPTSKTAQELEARAPQLSALVRFPRLTPAARGVRFRLKLEVARSRRLKEDPPEARFPEGLRKLALPCLWTAERFPLNPRDRNPGGVRPYDFGPLLAPPRGLWNGQCLRSTSRAGRSLGAKPWTPERVGTYHAAPNARPP